MNGLFESLTASHPLTQKSVALSRPVTVDGVTLFRHTVYLVVPLDAHCQRISLPDNARVTVHFNPTTVNVRHDSHAWNASPWAYQDESVIVHLTVPVRLHRIDSDGYGKAALHRVDGDKVISDPALVVSTHTPINKEFIASRFAIHLSGTQQQPNFEVQSALLLLNEYSAMQAQSSGSSSSQAPKVKMAKTGAGSKSQWDSAKLIEVLEAVFGYMLDAIVVQGQPTSPRMTLMNPASTESLWQWLECPGVQMQPCTVSVSGAQLQPALDRAFASRPAGAHSLILPLHIDSDAPCQVRLEVQSFVFRRETSLLPGGQPVTLRFSAEQQQEVLLPMALPPITPSLLELEFRRVKAGNVLSASALPAIATLPRQGFRLEAGDHVSMPLDHAVGVFVCGYAIPWWSLESPARLRLSLHVDQADAPAHRPLASAEITLDDERPAWVTFAWPAQTLQAGRYWLQLAVEDGSGLWLAGGNAVSLHRHRVNAAPEVIRAPQAPRIAMLVDSQSQRTGLSLSLNGTAVPLIEQGDRWLARLQAPLSSPGALALALEQGGVVSLSRHTCWY